MPLTPRPPDPDLVAARGTDQYRDAVNKLHKWVAYNFLRGVPLEELVERWGEGGSSREGRAHHDWEEWTERPPAEYYEELSNIGMFQKMKNDEGITEWPPGSGIFFNDPANDQSARQWFNQYGDRIPPPEDPGPDIDYESVNGEFGGSIQAYIKGIAARKADEAKAKAIGFDDKPMPAQQQPTQKPMPTPVPQPAQQGMQTGGGNNPYSPKKPVTSPMQKQQDPTVPSRFSAAITGQQTNNPGGSASLFGNRPTRNPYATRGRGIGSGWYPTWS